MLLNKNALKLIVGLLVTVVVASFTLLNKNSKVLVDNPKIDKLKFPVGFKAEHLLGHSFTVDLIFTIGHGFFQALDPAFIAGSRG